MSWVTVWLEDNIKQEICIIYDENNGQTPPKNRQKTTTKDVIKKHYKILDTNQVNKCHDSVKTIIKAHDVNSKQKDTRAALGLLNTERGDLGPYSCPEKFFWIKDGKYYASLSLPQW